MSDASLSCPHCGFTVANSEQKDVAQPEQVNGGNDPGFMYVLLNASMPGLVKIGKTTRTPNDRVQELSAATGVPTPFVEVYRAFFPDCSTAEVYVHTLLSGQGYRVSENREFFNAPVQKAIDAVIMARATLPAASNGALDEQNSTRDPKPSLSDENALSRAREIMSVADQYYYGQGDTLQDERRALELYRQAASLGCAQAYWCIGQILKELEDEDGALKAFNRGAELGAELCWAELAIYYSRKGHSGNATKAWARWFKSELALNPENITMIKYGMDYLSFVQNRKATDMFLSTLAPFRDVFLAAARKSLDEAGNGFMVPLRTQELGIVRDLLFPEIKRYLTFGQVHHVDHGTNGLIGLIYAKGNNYFFMERDLVGRFLIEEGEEVGFDAALYQDDGETKYLALNVRRDAAFKPPTITEQEASKFQAAERECSAETQNRLRAISTLNPEAFRTSMPKDSEFPLGVPSTSDGDSVTALYATCPVCNGVVKYVSLEIGHFHTCGCGHVLVLP